MTFTKEKVVNTIHRCDFCGDAVQSDDSSAMIYDARDFGAGSPLSLGFKGAWLACTTCASFIYQYDNDIDSKAKHNLAMRAMEKNRRRYGIRGMSDREVNKILMQEVNKLHEAFWAYRTDTSPVPYAIKQLEG